MAACLHSYSFQEKILFLPPCRFHLFLFVLPFLLHIILIFSCSYFSYFNAFYFSYFNAMVVLTSFTGLLLPLDWSSYPFLLVTIFTPSLLHQSFSSIYKVIRFSVSPGLPPSRPQFRMLSPALLESLPHSQPPLFSPASVDSLPPPLPPVPL